MKIYLVRLGPNAKNARELVGVYWADDVLTLATMIDEELDPAECEYAVLTRPAGIVWSRPGAQKVPLDLPDDELEAERVLQEQPDFGKGVEPSGGLTAILFGLEELDWYRLTPLESRAAAKGASVH